MQWQLLLASRIANAEPPIHDCVVEVATPGAPAVGWAADDRAGPALALTSSEEFDTLFEVRFQTRFQDASHEWAAGPWLVPAATTTVVDVLIPEAAFPSGLQAGLLTWIGATVGMSDVVGIRTSVATLSGRLTVEQDGPGFLTDARAKELAPGGAYGPQWVAALDAAQAAEDEGIALEIVGGALASAPPVLPEEVSP